MRLALLFMNAFVFGCNAVTLHQGVRRNWPLMVLGGAAGMHLMLLMSFVNAWKLFEL